MRHTLLLIASLSLSVFTLTGCPDEDEGTSEEEEGGGGTGGDDAAGGAGGEGGDGDGGTPDGGAPDAGGTGGTGGDDAAGGTGGDSGSGGGTDAGTALSQASCCEEHAEPGCVDVDTQACVCDKLPECCTDTWDLPCVLIVKQKYCEPGVRECVCGPESEGGWEQTQCCETNWGDLCRSTALIKCMGDPTCQ